MGQEGDGPSARAEQLFDRGGQALEAEDYPTALDCFRQAAEGGHPEAQYELGRMYSRGDGVGRDRRRAWDGSAGPPNRDTRKRRAS